MPTGLNFGAFNVRGVYQDWEKKDLVEDAKRYDLDISAITETHIGGESNTFEQGQYVLYTVNGEKSKNTHGNLPNSCQTLSRNRGQKSLESYCAAHHGV